MGQNDEAREEPSGSPDAGPPAEGGAGGAREETAGSSWMEKARAAQQLWDYGDNVALAKLLDELEKAPIEEQQALEIARDLRARLRPDPLAIGLWLVTLAIFCVVTYLFVLR